MSETFLLSNGDTLHNVHPKGTCAGWCVIHNPKPGPMNDWPLLWREDRGIFERLCKHGVGHPDPSQFDYWDANGMSWNEVHGCCGCCSTHYGRRN